MTAVRATITLDRELLDRVDAAARELDLPRSRFLARAADELLRRMEDRELLERLNRAYDDEPAPDEDELAEARRRKHQRLLSREPW